MRCALVLLTACAASDPQLACPPGTSAHYDADALELACTRPDGVREGPARAYFADGKLRITGGYAGDRPAGHWIWWRENGGKQAEGELRDGKVVGPYRIWHDNGQLYVADTYVDGKPEGEATRYHANGQRAAHGTFADGKKHGDWAFWYASGARERAGRYDHGKKVGTWQHWAPDGKELPDDAQ